MARNGMVSLAGVLKAFTDKNAVALFFLGFSAGVPILLIFSTLSAWLVEAGVNKSQVTFFSWAALGYSFKFLWSPLVDIVPLPFLTRRLGRRRGWLLLAQAMVIVAILCMAAIDPAGGGSHLTLMALAAVLLGFSSATQDIVIDAYRIECAEQSMQALFSSMYIAGYRIGMVVAGAGSLALAQILGSGEGQYRFIAWSATYAAMAAVMLVGIATTLLIREPEHARKERSHQYTRTDYLSFVGIFVAVATIFALTFFSTRPLLASVFTFTGQKGGVLLFMVEAARFILALSLAIGVAFIAAKMGVVKRQMVREGYLEPVGDFFRRYGMNTAMLLLLLIGFYRVSDIVLGVISNVFYLDIGFTKGEIAGVTKTFGVLMTLAGGLLGGGLVVRYGTLRILLLGAVLSSLTNLLFVFLAGSTADISLLTVVIAADNLSAGIATTAFVAFLSGLTSVSFTAVQYALFSSGMSLMPKVIGGYSGTIVGAVGYSNFFMFTALMGVPVVALILMIARNQKLSGDNN